MTTRGVRAVKLAILAAVVVGGSALRAADDLLFAQPRNARDLLTTVIADTAAKLRQARTLRGQFVLRKHLREIPVPLTAQGEFVFARELGIYWHTTTPFDSVFLLTSRGAMQRDEGATAFRSNAQQQAGVQAALEIFAALFALDVDMLSNNFILYGVSDAAGWRIGLRPRSNAMRAVFTQAVVSGHQQIERIELTDAGGDRTEIVVHGALAAGAPAEQSIRKLFAE